MSDELLKKWSLVQEKVPQLLGPRGASVRFWRVSGEHPSTGWLAVKTEGRKTRVAIPILALVAYLRARGWTIVAPELEES